ncbi:unnamed protein product [Caenorhabditis brenneri]
MRQGTKMRQGSGKAQIHLKQRQLTEKVITCAKFLISDPKMNNMTQNMENRTSSIIFNAEYTVKFPDLFFGILGLITNSIHLYFVILALKKHPIFQFLSLICIGDLVFLVAAVVIEFKGIIDFSEYKNCHSGYENTGDFWFKMVFSGLSGFGIYISNWLLILLAILQILDNKKRAVYTPKITATVTRGTVGTVILTVIFVNIGLVILFLELPYSPCDSKNLQKYMASHRNWITVVTWIASGMRKALRHGKDVKAPKSRQDTKITPRHEKRSRAPRQDSRRRQGVLTHLPCLDAFFGVLTDFQSPFFSDQVLTTEGFSRLFRTLSSNLRPIIIFAKSPEYQDTVKAIFSLTGTVVR